MNIKEFLEDIASENPTPGGGSVAAFAGSLSSALVRMVSNITLKKAEGVKKENFESLEEEARFLQNELWRLVDRDAESFNRVMNAFKLPKETPEEKEKRKEEIQKAFQEATRVPYETMEKSLQAGKLAVKVMREGNPNCITDGAVGFLMAHACMKGAALNVRINLGSVKDEEFKEKVTKGVDRFLEEALKLEDEVNKLIDENI